ncbi:MAG: hypothetical protein QHJ73_12545, partial [Armatimonadota bacterium]|nr:hypothetical protein [Armatimonadota bacterium]
MLVLAALTATFYWRTLFTDAVFLPADVVLRLQPWREYSRALFPSWQHIYNPLLDAVLLFYPWRVLAARAIGAGEIPLWNPDSFCGQPFLANVSSAVLYPLNVLFYLREPARAYGWVAALQTYLAGFFTFLLVRLLGARPAAALTSAIVFMLCGFFVVWAQYLTPAGSTLWLPLALYFWERYARGDGWRFAFYASAPLALCLMGGHLQYATYAVLAFAVFACWRSGWRPARWFTAGCVVAAAVALAGQQILPSLELGKYNHRTDTQTLAGVLHSGLPAKQLVTFLVPSFFGHPVDYNYWGHFNFVEMCGYLGVLPLLLAPLAVWLRRDGHTRFFAVFALVTLLMVMGTWLYAPLYYLVPGFKQLGNPARMLGVFTLAMACLAGLGLDALLDLPRERRPRALRVVLLLLAGACAGAGFAYSAHAETIAGYGLQQYVATAVAAFLATALACGAALWLAAGRPALAWLAPAVAAADLLLFGMRFNPAGDPRMLFFPTRSIDYLRAQPGRFRVMAQAAGGEDFMNCMIPNCNLVVGLAEVQGGDALYPRRFKEFVEFTEGLRRGEPFRVGNGVMFGSVETPGVHYLAPRYILSPVELTSPHLQHLGSPDIHLYRNKMEKPRARLVHRARVVQPGEALRAMAEEKFQLDDLAIVEETPAIPPQPARPGQRESAVIVDAAMGRVRLEVTASSSGLLV